MRLSTCPCFTLRRAPADAPSAGAALLMRAGYWLPSRGETPLGAAWRRRLRAYLSRALALTPSAWAQQPCSDAPLAPDHGPGTPRLAAVWQWARTFLTTPKRVPTRLAWIWPRPAGPLWGLYTWQWDAAAAPPLPDWQAPSLVEVPLGPGWSGKAWLWPTPQGEEGFTRRAADGAMWARVAATAGTAAPRAEPVPPEPRPETVPTPNAATVDAVAQQLGVSPDQVLKTLFWTARVPGPNGWTTRLVAALVPGHRRLSPWALAAALQAVALRPATDEEIRRVGAVPGYASPVGLDPRQVWVVLDAAAAGRGPWIMGANRPEMHLRFVWPERDFAVSQVTALSLAPERGQAARLVAWSGRVPTAWLRAAGVRLSDPAHTSRLDLFWLEVDVGSWAEALAEAHHDERGLRWPRAIAPADVHVVRLRPRRAGAEAAAVDALADEVVRRLHQAGWEVVDDDRDASPGVKFTDADLMGLPWRVVVSARHISTRHVEVRSRRAANSQLWPLEELPARLAEAAG